MTFGKRFHTRVSASLHMLSPSVSLLFRLRLCLSLSRCLVLTRALARLFLSLSFLSLYLKFRQNFSSNMNPISTRSSLPRTTKLQQQRKICTITTIYPSRQQITENYSQDEIAQIIRQNVELQGVKLKPTSKQQQPPSSTSKSIYQYARAVKPLKHRCHCGYQTRAKNDYDKHFRTHTGEKPYRCVWGEGCHFTAADRSNISRHVRVMHFKRPTCKSAFAEQNIVENRRESDYFVRTNYKKK